MFRSDPHPQTSDVDRLTISLAGRFVERFTEGRMRVDGRLNLLVGGFEVHREAHLGDEFRRLRADDVRAQDLAVRLAEEDLGETLRSRRPPALCRWLGKGTCPPGT